MPCDAAAVGVVAIVVGVVSRVVEVSRPSVVEVSPLRPSPIVVDVLSLEPVVVEVAALPAHPPMRTANTTTMTINR
jgi:hypothetical protein